MSSDTTSLPSITLDKRIPVFSSPEHEDSKTNDIWRTYTAAYQIQALAIEGDYVWVGTTGGVVRLNQNDGSFIKYTTSEGLADNDVNAITIDNSGNKWFGTDDGVSKFDGSSWKTYTTADGLGDNHVNAIAIDEDNHIWFGTYSNGVSRFDGNTWITYTNEDGLVSDNVQAIAVDSGGHIWLGTVHGINEYDGHNWKTYTVAGGNIYYNNFIAIAIDLEGNLWFGEYGDGVTKFDGSTWTTYTTSDGLANNYVFAIAIDDEGHKWFGTLGGISKFDGANWATYNTNDGLSHNDVFAMVIDQENNKWFGTREGLSKFDESTWTTYLTSDGLTNNSVLAVAIDDEGDKWFGTIGGISKFDGTNWTTYTVENGLVANGVHSIAIDKEGHKWFGTYYGVSEFDGTNWTTFTEEGGLVANSIRSIAIDAENHKWFGTSSGVSEFDGINWTTYTTENGLVANSITSIAIDTRGNKWFSTHYGVSVFDGISWNTYTADDGLASNFIRYIMADSSDRMWFGTSADGVSMYDGDTWYKYTSADGLVSDSINIIAEDIQGNIWIGTSDGVSVFNGSAWNTYTAADGLANNRIYAIGMDAKEHIWFGTAAGVSEFIPGGLETGIFITGRVMDNEENPISGVTISTSLPSSAVTDSNGDYIITDVMTGTYTITPSKDGYAFSPASRSVSVPPDVMGVDFVGTMTGGSLEIIDVEINQGLGNQYENGDPNLFETGFVAYKDTVIRVFLSEPVKPDPITQEVVVKRDGMNVLTLKPQWWFAETDILTFPCPNRWKCGHWQSGNYTFVVTINSVDFIKEVTFLPTKKLKILAIPISLINSDEDIELRDNDWITFIDLISQLYPIASINMGIELTVSYPLETTLDPTSEDFQRKLGGQLNKYNSNCGIGTDSMCFDQLVGILPPVPVGCDDEGKCTPGWSYTNSNISVIMANGSLTYTNSRGKEISIIIDSSKAIAAHEVGHKYQLGDEYRRGNFQCDINPPPKEYIGNDNDEIEVCPKSEAEEWLGLGEGSKINSIEDHPYDLIKLKSLDDKLSFMGSASAEETDYWITPRVYAHLLKDFDESVEQYTTEDDLSRMILAFGWISKDGDLLLEPWYSYTSTLKTEGSGTYSIEAIDAFDKIIARQGFDVFFSDLSNPPVELNPSFFSIEVPFPIGTRAFLIKKDDVVILRRNVSLNSPNVIIHSPNGGESWTNNETIIKWSGSDIDDDILHYKVQYSRDGKEWIVLATDITDTQLIIHPSELPGGNEARIRVVATDGVNTSVDESDGSFQVYSKIPDTFILAPTHNSCSLPKAGLYLHGYAYDLEDGSLDETAFNWKSDKDGDLGTGALLLVDLSYGQHTITLSVSDSDGNVATDSIQLFVGYKNYLPMIKH